MKGVLEEASRGKYYVLQVGGVVVVSYCNLFLADVWPSIVVSQAHQLACGSRALLAAALPACCLQKSQSYMLHCSLTRMLWPSCSSPMNGQTGEGLLLQAGGCCKAF